MIPQLEVWEHVVWGNAGSTETTRLYFLCSSSESAFQHMCVYVLIDNGLFLWWLSVFSISRLSRYIQRHLTLFPVVSENRKVQIA